MSDVNDPRSLDAHIKLGSSAYNVVAVTPDNNKDLPDGPCKALLVAADGNLSFTAEGGGNSGTMAVTAGMVIPVRVRKVLTATTATILALY